MVALQLDSDKHIIVHGGNTIWIAVGEGTENGELGDHPTQSPGTVRGWVAPGGSNT